MLRSTLLTATLTLGLGVFSSAQVVNNGGYVTTVPAVVNPTGAPSVPAINTPVAHVGPTDAPVNEPGQPAGPVAQTGAQNNAQSQPSVVQVQSGNNPVTVEVSPNASGAQTMNLGAASVTTNPFLGSGGSEGKPLGDIAREAKQKEQTTNAKTYTNADIDRLNQATGVNNGATATNASNEWPANNGVITPPQNNQNTIASPAQNQSTTGNAPFTPRPQNGTPAEMNNENAQPANPPQANAKPSAERPYEMAQNNPSNAGIPQAGNDQSTTGANDNATADNGTSKRAALPKTASRLPLIGVLGFFSISMGLFVRHQREKAK